MSQKTRRNSATSLYSTLFCLVVALVWYTVWSDLEPVASCESEGIHYIQLSLLAYLKHEHSDSLPSQSTLMLWATKNAGLPPKENIKPYPFESRPHYVWEGMFGRATQTPERALVWCATAHGPFWHRYKNVLFSDGSLRRVPASEFQNVLLRADSNRNTKYECVHKCLSVERL